MVMKVIYCAGEQGRVVLDILRSMGDNENVVFADDDPSLQGKVIQNTKVIGGIDEIIDLSTNSFQCIVAFGDEQEIRLKIANKIEEAGHRFFNAIHPSAVISERVTLGTDVIINGQSYIGPYVVIEDHVLIDSCVNISHDSTLERGATITPGVTIAGGVTIKKDGYVGPNATVLEDVTIGEGALVGAGSVVMEDVSAGKTVIGTPATTID